MEHLTTYAAWAKVLDQFASGNDTVLPVIESGSFVLDNGVAQRFYASVEKAYRMRKEQWLHKFNQALQRQRPGLDFAAALGHAKTSLRPLVRFVQAGGLPTDLRQVLSKDLEAFTVEVKQSLMTQVSKGSPHQEAHLLTLRSFDLPAMLGNILDPQTVEPQAGFADHLQGRKIIF